MITTLAFFAALLAVLYWYLTRTHGYWRQRGVKHDQPWPLFGTNAKNDLMQASFSMVLTETYNKYPGEKIVGYFRSTRPELIIRDPALAKRVLVNDFGSFHRRAAFPGKPEPLLKNQLSADDDLWRLLRHRMTPAFSSGKLKAMFPLIVEHAVHLQHRLRAAAAAPVDARELMARYNTDIIATIGFGSVSDSLNNKHMEFRELGKKVFELSFPRLLKYTLKSILPGFFHNLQLYSDLEPDVVAMVQSIMRQRKYEPSGRNDFIDILLECKKQGAMTGESIVETNEGGTPKKVSIEMDDVIMAAQSFVFFVAGFETSSSATSYTLHQLAHHPQAQRLAQEEIDRVLAKYDGKLCYDAVAEMTYLRWCLDEGLRLLPPVGFLQRQCVRPYTFEETGVSIDPGVNVLIPVEGYHLDPENFPDPEEFRPERFDPKVFTAEQKMAYLPFGNGHRACVAERLGLMQSLSGLAAVLAVSVVRPAPGSPRHPRRDPCNNGVQVVLGGLPLVFHDRDTFKAATMT